MLSETDITFFLRRIGLRATHVGFHYLACAIALVVVNEAYLKCLTTRLYPEIAQKFAICPSSVERSLRNMVEIFWNRGNVPLLEGMLGYSLPDKPTTGEFIDILASYLRLEQQPA